MLSEQCLLLVCELAGAFMNDAAERLFTPPLRLAICKCSNGVEKLLFKVVTLNQPFFLRQRPQQATLFGAVPAGDQLQRTQVGRFLQSTDQGHEKLSVGVVFVGEMADIFDLLRQACTGQQRAQGDQVR